MSGDHANWRQVLGLNVRLARHFWTRLVGLLGRSAIGHDEALLLMPCSNVHTFFMRFPIDVVFLSKDGQILAIHPAVRPWRASAARHAHACLEMASGRARLAGLMVGQCIPELAAAQLVRS
ncbi:DUF192 domain-containing protein [Massilia sp. CF038]|uniref:DUF192 domain-containing protein n=1 Tax=Massilia sp. CF038 TaxID=1881045 RepID=UPI000919186E|nr:DUF192 domain-containing protein [Massilia sp. CF038]SHH24673.1 hypothetical protein SAMN05428948_3498 [Massilia sp. CF038]